MARLYTNENFPHQVAEALRELGHDVMTSREAGNAGRAVTDEEVLAYAIASNRAALTLDRRDFIRLHEFHPDHRGIIVCTQDPDMEAQAQRIHQAILDNQPLAGRLIRVNRPVA